jgi:23S rRNA (cytidine1920-2'-O)/16S rRNA (cytidine1409-2'-O)-methyltransferase
VIAKRTRGVVTDPEERTVAIAAAREAIVAAGFSVLGECDSAVAGAKGNVEYFVYARRIEP